MCVTDGEIVQAALLRRITSYGEICLVAHQIERRAMNEPDAYSSITFCSGRQTQGQIFRTGGRPTRHSIQNRLWAKRKLEVVSSYDVHPRWKQLPEWMVTVEDGTFMNRIVIS